MNKTDLAFPYEEFSQNHKGLTKREYIATQVLSGLCSNSSIAQHDTEKYVKAAIQLTDELMKQLAK